MTWLLDIVGAFVAAVQLNLLASTPDRASIPVLIGGMVAVGLGLWLARSREVVDQTAREQWRERKEQERAQQLHESIDDAAAEGIDYLADTLERELRLFQQRLCDRVSDDIDGIRDDVHHQNATLHERIDVAEQKFSVLVRWLDEQAASNSERGHELREAVDDHGGRLVDELRDLQQTLTTVQRNVAELSRKLGTTSDRPAEEAEAGADFG